MADNQRSTSGLMHTVAVASVFIQGLVLAVWSRHTPVQSAVSGLVGVGLAGYLATLPENHPRMRLYIVLATGGAGMVLGSWSDWGFSTPTCLCCIYEGPLWPVWKGLLTSNAVLAMLLAFALCRSRTPPAGRAWFAMASLGYESFSMILGMFLASWLGSYGIRQLPGWKLEAGHGAMLAGMVLGCECAALMQQRLTCWVQCRR